MVLGEYGGKVIRRLETGAGPLLPGAIITPAMAMAIPGGVPRRLVLERTKFVEWFNQPIPGGGHAQPEAQQEAAATGRRK